MFELRSLVTNASLGRVKIAPEKNAALTDRVEFPNEWFRGDEHGLEHDGQHGDGTILMLERRSTTPSSADPSPLVRVTPWLAYGCGERARCARRAPSSKCATVQRAPATTPSCSVRRLMSESSVDPSPLTVVRTTRRATRRGRASSTSRARAWTRPSRSGPR